MRLGDAQAAKGPLQIMARDLSNRDRATPPSNGEISTANGVVSNHVDQIAVTIAYSVSKSPVPGLGVLIRPQWTSSSTSEPTWSPILEGPRTA